MNPRSTVVILYLCILGLSFYPLSMAIGESRGSHFGDNENSEITPGELLIRVTPEAETEFERLHAKSAVQQLHDQMGVRSFHRVFPHVAHPELNPNLGRVYLLRFSVAASLDALKAAYAANPLIEAVEFNYLRPTQAGEIAPNDPRYAEQWNLPIVNMPQAWAIEKGDPDVIIAIVDTGVDYTHEDLASKIWINAGEIPDNGVDDDGNGYVDDLYGWDFTDAPNVAGGGDFLEGDNDPMDDTGHGTHVAGIAGAAVDNGIGVAGVAWNCTLMPVRSGSSVGGSPSLQDDDSSAAIVYAVDNGAKVINMSWGSRRNSFVIRDVIDYAYARGVLLVAAAGNDFEKESIFPAGYRKVIAVAATEQNKRKYYQSNFGASVDIGAPGNVILSTFPHNQYGLLTGTSMATPHVSGVAALMMSKRPGLTHEEARQILVATADPIPESPELVGAGHLNAARALMASGSLQARILSPETNSGGSNAIKFVGTAGGFKFSAWQLLYGESTVPIAWQPINAPSQREKANEELLVWDTSAVGEGIYTVRLEVAGKDGKVVRDEVVVSVDRTPPQVRNVKARAVLSGNSFTTIVTWATDDITIDTLNQRSREGLVPFTPIEESSFSKEHIFALPLGPGSYDFFITSHNIAGLETVDDNNGKFYHAEVTGESISPNGFVRSTAGAPLPPMALASVTADFDRDNQPEIVGMPLTNADASTGIEIYERSPTGAYHLQHTGTFVFKPWAVDDTDGDGLLEILGSTAQRTFLIESVTQNGYPERIIWESPLISSGQIADLDGDGRKEIIGPDNNNDQLLIFENRGNDTYAQILALRNNTEGSNIFGEQFAIGDFDGDGRAELMTGDSEGELFIYESVGDDRLVETWRGRLNVSDAHQLAAGDLTGDGIPEFVVGGTVSEADLPSLTPDWEYTVWTTTGPNRYTRLWTQDIAPFRLRGNSLAIGDVDGDAQNELVILANPSVYLFKWNGTTFSPIWYRNVWETPRLLLADVNRNGFSELYFNDRENLLVFEHARAGNPDSIANLQPWDVSATPFTERIVRLSWEAPEGAASFALYRAVGTPDNVPSDFEQIADGLDFPGFLDRNVVKDRTYWYAVTAKNGAGIETDPTEPVSVTPRTPPKLIAVEYLQSNQLAVIFDKPMALSIGDERRYLLRQPEQLVGVNPTSAIRDEMGRRAVLTFQTGELVPGQTYEITVENVRDTDKNPIDLRGATRSFEVPAEPEFPQLTDFAQAVVYPNPVRPNEFHKGVVKFDHIPTVTTIEIYNSSGDLLETLRVEATDHGQKEWMLLNNGILEVTSGVYIYAMEFGKLKKIGKIAVIR